MLAELADSRLRTVRSTARARAGCAAWRGPRFTAAARTQLPRTGTSWRSDCNAARV